MPKVRRKAVTSRSKPNGKRRPAATEIALRAYQIFIGRGGGDGHDVEDWLKAEAELVRHSN